MIFSVLALLTLAAAGSGDVNCHSISSSATDGWCNSNCNYNPPNCPASLCKCDTPTPAPTPPPGPTPPPSPPAPPSPKAIIGYWGSAADLPTLDQIPEALKRGYNVIALAFGDTMKADGTFEIHTNLGAPPTKASISSAAGIASDKWQYIVSFGGQNAAGPPVSDINSYVTGFMSTYHDVRSKYGFDGIDIDIETGMLTPLLKAFREIFKQLHAEGAVISMAPQPLNIDPVETPVFVAGAYNAYVPLVDTTIIDCVTYVAPQLYNNGMPLNDLEKYIASMQQNAVIAWEGQNLQVNIPSSKLVFGYPATSGAAPSGPSQPWESSGSSIVSHYKNSPVLMGTGGVMTWSVGWDHSSGWSWISAVSGLWGSYNETIQV